MLAIILGVFRWYYYLLAITYSVATKVFLGNLPGVGDYSNDEVGPGQWGISCTPIKVMHNCLLHNIKTNHFSIIIQIQMVNYSN